MAQNSTNSKAILIAYGAIAVAYAILFYQKIKAKS
jgi:hypothetical protein